MRKNCVICVVSGARFITALLLIQLELLATSVRIEARSTALLALN
jgi:hypothetical protein